MIAVQQNPEGHFQFEDIAKISWNLRIGQLFLLGHALHEEQSSPLRNSAPLTLMVSIKKISSYVLIFTIVISSLNDNPTKWSNTLKQFVELFECVWLFCGVSI